MTPVHHRCYQHILSRQLERYSIEPETIKAPLDNYKLDKSRNVWRSACTERRRGAAAPARTSRTSLLTTLKH